MKIILLLVLCISLYPASNTKDDCPSNIICGIAGRIWSSNFETFEFNISAMPEDCGIFLVAQFDFDRDTRFMDSDENIVTTLTSAGKIVYTSIGFHYDDNWPLVFEADEKSTDYKTEIIDPLVTFLNANNLSGVIINMDYVYDGYTDYPQKMSTFVTKIKKSVKHDLKFGLQLGGWPYANFSCSECFDFSITNSVLDLYIIDFYMLNICDSDGKQYGLAPITCQNPNMTTMEQVTAAINNSSMDQSKMYCLLGSSVFLPDDQSINDKKITSYSTYCSSSSISSQWCANPSELSYQQGQYAKKHFKGLVTRTLDTDDYNNSCNCGLFSVTNLFISGWKSTSLKPCDRIDKLST